MRDGVNLARRGVPAVVVLNPEHAAVLAGAGWSRADVAAAIHDRAGNTRSGLAQAVPAFAGAGDPDDSLRCFESPDDVLVLVAGGGGLYSTVFPTWCAGGHRNRAISVTLELDQACAIPGLA